MKTSQCSKEIETPIYTNSTQLPVDYCDNILKVIELQDELQCQYTGGTVQHIFLGEEAPDYHAVKEFVKMVCSNYRMPYITISPSFSICPEHGYIRGEEQLCPKCDAPTEIYSRVVGYLRPVQQWNDGKKKEFGIRSHFSIGKNS